MYRVHKMKKPDLRNQAFGIHNLGEMNMVNLSKQAIENNTDFLVGDVVVHVPENASDDLFTVLDYQPNDHYWLESDYLVHQSNIRHATPAELNAKRRLTNAEQALTEVS